MFHNSETYNFGKQDFFQYLQFRHCFDKNIKTTGVKGMSLIRIIINAYKSDTKKKISRIYSSLQNEKGLSTMYVKSRWEKENNIKLTKDWLNICRTQFTTLSSDLLREFAWTNVLWFSYFLGAA